MIDEGCVPGMAKFSVRRYSDPFYVLALKEAIVKISAQKQCPNEGRIVRSVLQEFDWSKSEITKQLKFAVKDDLILQVTTFSSHGSTKGIPQTAYRIRRKDGEDDEEIQEQKKKLTSNTHDWYCWGCHRAGEVIACDYCPRVFHKKCAHSGTVSNGKWKCPSCQPQKLSALLSSKTAEQLSRLLKFTLERMKEKAKEFLVPVSLDEHTDYEDFIFKPMDLTKLEKLIDKRVFKTPREFREESQWMFHNAVIYFGDDDDMTDLAEAIMEDCDGELEEMMRCPDCYLMSNTRTKNWFCKPCYFPHELVWAKMTGEPPWPAKMLTWSEDSTKALVRFFGSAHQRAWVGRKHITPITTKPEVKKRSQRWVQACAEMTEYQRQLALLYPDSKQQEKSLPSPNKTQCKEIQTDSHTCSQEDDDKIRQLEEKIKQQQEEFNSLKADLDCERVRAEQLVQDVKRRKEEQNQRVLRDKSVREQSCHEMSENCSGPTIDLSATRDQTSVIKMLQDALERERQEKNELLEKVTRESQKNKEREIQQAVKRAVNKERLERERVTDEAVKKAIERCKQEKEKHFQKALQCAKEDAEKSQQEAVNLAKKKQWCASCRAEAFYPCCWNTSYCTLECQKTHWCTHRFHCMRVSCNCRGEGPMTRT
ncbi:zinc finger MYND domain-containing protein 11-like [Montipora capricornis]|uniref:zinc finger MYND domain-containing protein 11-like n=1 Tax=Montipora capricornis TaxID=246305 RepID=UPI0035F1AE50